MNLNQPYYMVNFNAAACLFEIRINDVPILQMELEGQASSKIPCNHAIFNSGRQEISLIALPLKGELSLSDKFQLQSNIELYEVSDGFVFKEMFEKVEDNELKNQSIPISKKKASFNATVPYKIKDFWSDGKDLKRLKNLKEKLEKAYLNIANSIESKNYSIFKQEMANREYNMATAMYLSQKDSNSRLESMIQDFENGFNTAYLAKDSLVVYSCYGKKASLKRSNGEPALSFVNREKKEQLMLDIEFYLPQNSMEFHII